MLGEPAPDAPRATPGTVAFCFGFFARERIPGPLLVQVMSDLGIAPTSSRALFSRMFSRGQLESHRKGRVAIYQLAGTFAEQFRSVRHHLPEPDWPGYFDTVVYDVAESNRPLRDELRREAVNNGFESPRPGMLIGIGSADWVHRCESTELAQVLEIGQFHCSVESARRLAESAWNLTAHAERLRQRCDELEAEIASNEQFTDGATALRSHYDLWVGLSRITLDVPSLPTVLLPDGWCRGRLQELTMERSSQHTTPLDAYAESLRATPRYADFW